MSTGIDSDRIISVTDENYREVLADESHVVFHFRADWCEPCNSAVAPVLADLAEAHPDVTIATVDAETGQEVVQAFDVETLLTTVLVVQGDEVARFPGKAPYVKLDQAIREHR